MRHPHIIIQQEYLCQLLKDGLTIKKIAMRVIKKKFSVNLKKKFR